MGDKNLPNGCIIKARNRINSTTSNVHTMEGIEVAIPCISLATVVKGMVNKKV